VSFLRRLSTRSLLVLLAVVAAVAIGGAAIAVAAGGSGSPPPPKPLDQAIQDALTASPPQGVTARVKFTNNLFPSGALLGQATSALLSGASGRLWMTNDGAGRIELQSDAGDVQIVWNDKTISVYDASSNTVYRADLPAATQTQSGAPAHAAPTLADIDSFLTDLGVHWAVSTAQPTVVGGQSAYSASVAPKHDGGLLGSVDLAWDAVQGVPLRLAINAQGSGSPALALTVKNIRYGPVASSDVDIASPAGAKVVDLATPTAPAGGHETPAVTGLDAVQAAADFPVTAPDSLVGLPRRDVRLIGGDTAIAFYGEGLGGIVLVERKADAGTSGNSAMAALPSVSLDGVSAHELATELGTVLQWQSGGTTFVLAGSQPPAAAEAAARAVK
jgi:hypothetical protein